MSGGRLTEVASSLASIQDSGFAVILDVLDSATIKCVGAAIDDRLAALDRTWGAGKRNLFAAVPDLVELVTRREIRSRVEPILGENAFAVRAVFFDKSPSANWKIFWHQDSTITVRQRRDVAGFVGWSQKEGVTHVVPPAEVLAGMLTVRVHLDDCGPDNGPLRVLPGSHRFGWINETELPAWRERVTAVECCVPNGGVMLMRPLLLHASSPAVSPHRRRVVHIEFAATDLPGGLEWHERVGPAETLGS